ncbi:MAG: alkyl hydroperoxide reductase/Thiol specific antioxidant/Mal allergen [Candidatus Angelobacter sp.]|jgi:peroxiredoxin Q/BCP|nr:alkyl hydroperoxide reductase/Thiol specific antioxidant/Mal allergen [Candidatus Angelobacter sp.]
MTKQNQHTNKSWFQLFGLVLMCLLALLPIAVRAADKALAVGSKSPEFTLTSQDGVSTSLSQFKGKWVVLYFYPKDFTQGCTIEAHNFQRDEQQYEKKNTVVLGVSLDSVDSHKNFCAKEGLSFKLLADPSHEVAATYGSLMDFKGTTYAARNTFIVDPSGVIRKMYKGVNPNKHSEEVLAALSELQVSQ